MNDFNIKPLQLPSFGELNSIYPHIKPAFYSLRESSGTEIIKLLLDDLSSPRVIDKQNGEFTGIVFNMEKDVATVSSDTYSVSLQAYMSVQNKSLNVHRVFIPELHVNLPLPNDYYNCRSSIGYMYPLVPFPSNCPSLAPGDIVRVKFLDKNNLQNPIGIEKLSTEPIDLSLPPKKATTEPEKTQLAAKPPSAGNQFPKIPALDPNLNCGLYPLEPGQTKTLQVPTKGLKDCWENGKFVGQKEMVDVPNAPGVVFPKEYLKALVAMQQQYERDNGGEKLGMISGYRDVDLQAKLYACHVAIKAINNLLKTKINPERKDKGLEEIHPVSTSSTSPPGYSNHNSGKAMDFLTDKQDEPGYPKGIGWNGKWAVYSKGKKLTLEQSKLLVSPPDGTTPYGKVAKWLVNNSSKYGFIWEGYSFGELWHYKFEESKAPKELIDKSSGYKPSDFCKK